MRRKGKSTFAKRLERTLEYRQISRAALAKELRVSRTCVSAWCAGTANPLLDHFEKIADVLQVRAGYLMGDDDAPVSMKLERLHRELLEQEGVERPEVERRLDELNDYLLFLRSRTRGRAADS